MQELATREEELHEGKTDSRTGRGGTMKQWKRAKTRRRELSDEKAAVAKLIAGELRSLGLATGAGGGAAL